MNSIVRTVSILTWSLLVSSLGVSGADLSPDEEDFFESRIRPLLSQSCSSCHGSEKQEAGLRLDLPDAVTRGDSSGPVVVPGNPDASRLIGAVEYNGDVQMPPDGKLATEKIALLREWVGRGAPWPATAVAATDSAVEPSSKARDHWAFQPVHSPPVPPVNTMTWPQNSIDSFVLAKLETQGLTPSPAIDRRTLMRRISYDLIGLPPTAEELNAFESDPSPDAVAQLVERLLASPRYGERWGRHWLDIARYADTKGYVGVDAGDIERREYPYAFAYRDWVISAFNSDLPYDQFIAQQIAADRLACDNTMSHQAALGFFRVGRVFLGNRQDQIDDKIDVLMRGTQGLTVACARCHDHKFDPIPTADYYALYGVFDSTEEPDDPEQMRMLLRDAPQPHNARILKRGNPATPGEEVPRRFVGVLSKGDRQPFQDGSGRLELARAITSKDNPLTARVWVNRVWGHHFGTPLVPTTSDFGIRTPQPEQVELLDWLAATFMADGWSIKQLHRRIVLSATYAQSSQNRPDCDSLDPQNRLLWRSQRRRLDFEQMRDSMLLASGELRLAQGGKSEELSAAPYSHRRAVYGRVDRQNLPGLFRTFDFANPDGHSAGRFQTTVPQQGLFLLNDPFVLECAQSAVDSAGDRQDPAASEQLLVTRLYRQILQRDPDLEELDIAASFVAAQAAGSETFGSWARLAHSLIMTNEFAFID